MIHDKLQRLVDELLDAGIRATLVPEDMNPPAVWVTLESVTDWSLAGDGIVRARIVLAVPNSDHRQALTELGTLLADVTPVIDPMSDVTPLNLSVPAGETLPALTYTYDTDS